MKLALFQSRPRHDIAENLAMLDAAAGNAMAQGADLLVTPEMYLTGYAIGAEAARRLAMSGGDESLRRVADIASGHGIGILTGFPEANGGQQPFNSVRLFGRDGATLATYRKTHLWPEVDAAQFSPGDALSPIVSFEGWRLALAICYDIEFPEVSRALRLAGAEAILVPTACKKPFSSVSTRMVPSRAEENAVYVGYCNYCGSEGAIEYFGMSTLCGPDGGALAFAAEDEGLSFATLDRTVLDDTRRRFTHVADRQPQFYGSLTKAD